MAALLRVCSGLGLALAGLLAAGCAVDRAGAGRLGLDGSVDVRDSGRRDAAGDPDRDGATPDDDGGPTDEDGGSTGSDGGSRPDAGADAGPPPDVSFEVRVDGTYCPALASCGGALEGTWQVSGGCVDFVQVNTLRSPGVCPSATVTAMGTAGGRVVFAGGTMTRELHIDWRGAVAIPKSCADRVLGCGNVENLVRGVVPDATVSCPADSSGGCACSLSIARTTTDASAIRIEGNQIVRDMDGRRWDYCVSDDSLLYRGTVPTLEPGTFEFMRI